MSYNHHVNMLHKKSIRNYKHTSTSTTFKLSHIIAEFSAVIMLVFFSIQEGNSQNMLCILMIYLHTKLHMPSCNVSLFTTIKEDKCTFHMVITLSLYSL